MSVASDSKTNLSIELLAKQAQLSDVTQKILSVNIDIQILTLKFSTDSNKIHNKLSKVQLSRPRGNPANYWPHRPMTNRISLFYQTKERKVSLLNQRKELLKLTFEHSRAILVNQKLVLISEQRDVESQIKLIRIRLGLPINLLNWSMKTGQLQ